MADIRPNDGPQREFCRTAADIAIYGGAAGSGKSFALLYAAAKYTHVPGYTGVVFRRTAPELVGGGSLWELATQLYPVIGARYRESPVLECRFPSNALIEFRHLQHDKDKHAHQGKQYSFIGFDEVTHFEPSQFWYLVSRMRSTCGVRPFLRATCNPDPDSFIRTLIDWWIDADGYPIPERSGVLRWFVRDGDELVWGEHDELARRFPKLPATSLTFIPAKLADNPKLLEKDPAYEARLLSLPTVERERLLYGNWNIRPAAGDYFKREWFPIVDETPGEVAARLRAWDKAATEPSESNPDPDWTRGARVALLRDGRIVIEDIVGLRGRPLAVETAMRNTAEQDGRAVPIVLWQDPGQAGVVDVEHTLEVLFGFAVKVLRTSKDKETYAGAWSAKAERGKVLLVRGPWNEAFLGEAGAFPKGRHDDAIDAVSLAVQALAGGVTDYDYTPAKEERDRDEWDEDDSTVSRGAL